MTMLARLGPTVLSLLLHCRVSESILSSLDSGEPGRECGVNGRTGVCMYSMLCTFANGTHLGTCRDRFIFGSCCRLPSPEVEPVVADSWEDRVNSGREDEVGLRLKYTGTEVTAHHCGAVLINHHWVATAAHCVYKTKLSKFVLFLGDYDNNDKGLGEGQMRRNVKKVLIHPKYRHQNYDNDLALLKLESPIEYNKYILPICLPPEDLQLEGRKGFVTGWGRIYEGGPKPSKLIEVDVPVISNSECNNLFKKAGLDEHVSDDIWVCAGYREGGKDACDGDSGGPLSVEETVAPGETVWLLGGIISWGPNSCGERNRPGVYTRIPSYTQWIQDNTRIHHYEWSTHRALLT